MKRVRSKDTKPEIALRRLVHGMGFRYRLHRGDLPGKPDMVFPSRRKVVFLHGCFWHGHKCKSGSKTPKANQDYWLTKLARNRERDKTNLRALEKDGWRVMVVWECELKKSDELVVRIREFLDGGSDG